MYNIVVKEKQKNIVELNLKNLKLTKKQIINNCWLEIKFSDLNFDVNIYGNNKKDSKQIQKNNCKKVVVVYRSLVSLIKYAKRKKIKLNNSFLVADLNEKKNNNDLMLLYMLRVKFETKLFHKLYTAVDLACDYLDNENESFAMCDFKGNKCAKARVRGFSRPTGCCPAKCKFMDNCPCKTKNISCKFIFCDYLEDKGFCINPLSLPIFVVNLSFFQRVVSWGLFFKSQKKVAFWLRFVNVLSIIAILTIVFAIVKLTNLI